MFSDSRRLQPLQTIYSNLQPCTAIHAIPIHIWQFSVMYSHLQRFQQFKAISINSRYFKSCPVILCYSISSHLQHFPAISGHLHHFSHFQPFPGISSHSIHVHTWQPFSAISSHFQPISVIFSHSSHVKPYSFIPAISSNFQPCSAIPARFSAIFSYSRPLKPFKTIYRQIQPFQDI